MATKDITDEQVVRAAILHSQQEFDTRCDTDVADILRAETGQAYKVCVRAIERAATRGYVNWGVVVTRPWAEPEGLELIGIPIPPPKPVIDWGDNLAPYITPTP